MNNQKVLLIDGLYTIYSNGYFVKDIIPRLLASYIDNGFDIWFVNANSIEEEAFNDFDIPSWLRQSMKTFSSDSVEDMRRFPFHSKSLLISDNVKRAESYKLNLRVQSSVNFFESEKFEPLHEADIIISFGFNSEEFLRFCKNKNLIGVEDENLVNIKSNCVGIAILSATPTVADDVEYGLQCLENLVNEGVYKVKYNRKILGVTLKGKGLEGKSLDMYDTRLPLVLV